MLEGIPVRKDWIPIRFPQLRLRQLEPLGSRATPQGFEP
jgi:hypothetical protein